jgi:hypothetical protein
VIWERLSDFDDTDNGMNISQKFISSSFSFNLFNQQ